MKITKITKCIDKETFELILKVEVDLSISIFDDFRRSLATQNVNWSQQQMDEEVGIIWGMEFLSQLREKLV
jgi:hypothetical protein